MHKVYCLAFLHHFMGRKFNSVLLQAQIFVVYTAKNYHLLNVNKDIIIVVVCSFQA